VGEQNQNIMKFKTKQLPEEASLSSISTKTSFDGTIKTDSNLRIDGYFKGNITSTAKIVIGEHGILDGNIACQEISVYGNLKGTVKTYLISANKGSVTDANISYEKLALEEGSIIKGVLTLAEIKTETTGGIA